MRSRSLARARYSAQLLDRVTDGWRRLWEDEREGVIRAARVAGELTALAAPPALLATTARIVSDEIRHVTVCARVLEELEAPAPPDLELTVSWPRPAAANEAVVARTLIADFALRKPLAAASFAAARAAVREPLFAWAYTELLHDEPRHGAFGAQAAAWVLRRWSPRQRQALWTRCLLSTETPGTSTPRDAEAVSLGLVPPDPDPTLPRWLIPHLAPLRLVSRPANDSSLLQ